MRLAIADRRRPAIIHRDMDTLDVASGTARIRALAKDYPAGYIIPVHTHDTAQLILAVSGAMRVATRTQSWLTPPEKALWMPAGVPHAIEMIAAVAMRSVYVPEASHPRLPKACEALDAAPILAALVRTIAADAPTTETGRQLRDALLLEELSMAPAAPSSLPRGSDPRLQRATERLLRDPATAITIDALAAEAGASGRTLARLFRRETGLSLRQWRERQRLIEALERLAGGQSVGEVAALLGYASASAFGAMVKRATGRPAGAFTGTAAAAAPARARAPGMPPTEPP